MQIPVIMGFLAALTDFLRLVPSEMRAIQAKQQETGFINVSELIELQKAGFQRPKDVPPKPTPKDRATYGREPSSECSRESQSRFRTMFLVCSASFLGAAAPRKRIA
jgi:hypothetical protein